MNPISCPIALVMWLSDIMSLWSWSDGSGAKLDHSLSLEVSYASAPPLSSPPHAKSGEGRVTGKRRDAHYCVQSSCLASFLNEWQVASIWACVQAGRRGQRDTGAWKWGRKSEKKENSFFRKGRGQGSVSLNEAVHPVLDSTGWSTGLTATPPSPSLTSTRLAYAASPLTSPHPISSSYLLTRLG